MEQFGGQGEDIKKERGKLEEEIGLQVIWIETKVTRDTEKVTTEVKPEVTTEITTGAVSKECGSIFGAWKIWPLLFLFIDRGPKYRD